MVIVARTSSSTHAKAQSSPSVPLTCAATGVAVTSIRQPLVDELTVRQLGGIVYALSEVVDARIAAGQAELFTEVQDVSPADLAKLTLLDLAASDAPRE